MKRLLTLAATAALILASCSRMETSVRTFSPPAVKDGIPIGFSNYTPKNLSKAGDTYVAENALVTGKHFAVYAWSTAYGSFLAVNPGAPNFMTPADVTYAGDNTDGKTNTYTPTRYWPSGDQPANLSFVSYYPLAAGSGISVPAFNANTVGVYTFTAKTAAADMVDFCVSDVVNDQVYGNTNESPTYKQTVRLPFKHQLTKVQFKFKKSSGLGTMTVIELLDAKLIGIKNTGTLTATYAQNASPGVNKIGTTTTAWSSQGGAQGYEIFVNTKNPEYSAPTATNPVLLSETASSVANGDIFLMVPQDMADDTQRLSVTWRVRVYDTADHATANAGTAVGGMLSETVNTKTLEFKDDLVMETWDHDSNPSTPAIPRSKNWVKNQFVTYTVTIGPSPILFTGSVANWDAEQNGYFNVN